MISRSSRWLLVPSTASRDLLAMRVSPRRLLAVKVRKQPKMAKFHAQIINFAIE